MFSTRRLTDIPSCMRMSFNFPWESSPEKTIADPLSYDPPDVTSDFGTIYGEEAAKDFFSCTPSASPPAKGVNLLPVLQEDSTFAGDFLEPLESELTPESSPKSEDSPTSPSSYANGLDSMLCGSPSPSPKRRVLGGKKDRRTRCVPREGRQPAPPSTSCSVSIDPDDVLTPEFMRRLQLHMPITPAVGPSSLPESRWLDPRSHLSSNPPTKLRFSRRRTRNLVVNASKKPEAFADLYCRVGDCGVRYSDKRTVARHRLTHVGFGMYACPNLECPSRRRTRPNFSRDCSLKRHFESAKPDSPCAKGKTKELSKCREGVGRAKAIIRRHLVPFDPAIHTPF